MIARKTAGGKRSDMKIAVTSSSGDFDSEIDERFGRAGYFIIYDTEKDEFYSVDNSENLNAMQGAGVQAASNVASENVDVVLTGHCGPKAFSTLKAAGIEVVTGMSGSIKEVVDEYRGGDYQKSDSPDVKGHW